MLDIIVKHYRQVCSDTSIFPIWISNTIGYFCSLSAWNSEMFVYNRNTSLIQKKSRQPNFYYIQDTFMNSKDTPETHNYFVDM